MRQLMETRIQKILEHNDAGDIHLTEREEEFLNDIIDKCGDPGTDRENDPGTQLTERQEEWVTGIYEKYLGGRIYK